MELKTEVIFHYFFEVDGEMIGHFEMEEGYQIPLNICIDNIDDVDIQPSEIQSIEIHGVCGNLEVYPTEETYEKEEKVWAPMSLIPIGTFPANEGDEKFQPSADILFSGRVLQAEYDSDAAPGTLNYALVIKTVDMIFILHTRYTDVIEVGSIVHGSAWLFGNLENDMRLQIHIENNETSKNNALKLLEQNMARLEENIYQAIIYTFDDGSVLQFLGRDPFVVECVEQIDGHPHIQSARQNDRGELSGTCKHYYYDTEYTEPLSEVMAKDRLTEFCHYMITNHSCGSLQTLLTEAAEVCGLHYVDVPFNPSEEDDEDW